MTGQAEFETLFRKELHYVLRSLRRLGVHERDLEDLGQDVFLAAYHRLGEFDANRPVRPWLFAFAFRAASNFRRLARHRRERDSEPGRSKPSASPRQDAELEREQDRELLLRALDTLDFDHRAAIVMVDLDEVPPKDVAALLELPLGTVYSRVRNGRQRLREAVASIQLQETTISAGGPA